MHYKQSGTNSCSIPSLQLESDVLSVTNTLLWLEGLQKSGLCNQVVNGLTCFKDWTTKLKTS